MPYGGMSAFKITATGTDQEAVSGSLTHPGSKVWGFDLVPDGTNSAELIIYDGAAASAKIIGRARAITMSAHARNIRGVAYSDATPTTGGLRYTLSGTGATAIIYYE